VVGGSGLQSLRWACGHESFGRARVKLTEVGQALDWNCAIIGIVWAIATVFASLRIVESNENRR
jgi:hypothetical protein